MDTDTPAVITQDREQGLDATLESQDDQVVAAPEESVDSFTPTDIAALPDELKALAKQLQGDYTRKTQDLADIRHKADAFDDLVSNPGFTAMMENIEKFGSPFAPPPTPEVKMTGEELLLKMIEDPDYFWNEVDRRAEEKARTYVTPITEREALSETNAEVARLSNLYPDFIEYGDAIADVLERSNYSVDAETAYKIATYDKVRTIGREEGAKTTEARVKSATSTSSQVSVKPTLKNPTMAEAYAAAKKALGV